MQEWIIQLLITSIVIPFLIGIGRIVSKLVNAKVNAIIDNSTLQQKEAFRGAFSDAMGNLSSAVYTAVMETQQTFVASLQKEGAFTADKQKEAFTLAFNKVKDIMKTESLEIIENATQSLDKIITAEIESQLPQIKATSAAYTIKPPDFYTRGCVKGNISDDVDDES